MSSNLITILVAVVVIGTVFGVLWWQGYLVRISNYVQQTREELRKCTWPSWEELKGSTVVVTISIILIGGFTIIMDRIFFFAVLLISKL